jgi:hypothetical protein
MLERRMDLSINEGLEQFVERGWVTAMETHMKEKMETRSLKIVSLKSDIIGKTCIEGMRIMVHAINVLTN